jgi:5-methyltetrahydrofolate--homocysteine methyltransferase
MRGKLTDTIKSGKILISDGAWGTILQEKGLKAGECPELWNITHPEEVQAIAENYIKAGADIVETNSFGGSRFKLEHFELADRVEELNETAARLSRKAAGDDRWVTGSIGPTGKMLITGDVTEEELYEAFKVQAIALEKGGADAVCIETMSDSDEARIAVKAAKENTKLEIICTFTFNAVGENDFYTMMGITPAQAAEAAIAAGADIIGSNCGNGIKNMVRVVRLLRRADAEIPVMIQANAGLPMIENGKTVYPESPEQMSGLMPEIIRAGANIVGGCCGTTPAHIHAIKSAINNFNKIIRDE